MNAGGSSPRTLLTTPSDTEVALTRVHAAPRDRVFEAWTNPLLVPRWLTGPEGWTMPVCEIDLRPGGSWRFVWRKSSGTEMEMRGGYVEVVRPERLVTTERWGPEWPETTNTLVLTEASGRTTSVLTVRYPSKATRDAAMATGMANGMDESYDRLEAILSGRR